MNILKNIKSYLPQSLLDSLRNPFIKYFKRSSTSINVYDYHPTFYMKNPIFQLLYGACQPKLKLKYQRDKLYQEDGGHVTLDWYIDSNHQDLAEDADICLMVHGLTGGSQMNYIKHLMREGRRQGYRCVCFNSRGISEEMTSPMPFTGTTYEEIDSAMNRIKYLYPGANVYLVGASFGGNYILRYLLQRDCPTMIKGVVCLAPPFNVNKVVEHMKPVYQKFFVKRYIKYTIQRHPIMVEWHRKNIICLNKVYNSTNLFQYHQNLTVPIVNYPNVNVLFETYYIGKQIKDLKIPTLIILARDDPIVSIQDVPHQAMKQNPQIKVIETNFGSHCCWFEGFIPKRWYPKPTLRFFNQIRDKNKNKGHNKDQDIKDR